MSDEYNALVARFYNRSTLVEYPDTANDGARIEIERFVRIYPGGFAECQLVMRRDPVQPLAFPLGARMRIYNGATIVWEGDVVSTDHFADNTSQGVRVSAIGLFGIVMSRTIEKYWADNRMTADVWYEPATAFDGNDKTLSQVMQIDRVLGRIRFTPKNEAFAVNQYHRAEYAMPTGQTVKRVKCSYNMQEAAQAWVFGLFNTTAGAAVWNVTASGAGTRDDTLGTPSNKIWLYLQSGAAQTPTSDGVYYGQVDSAISGATAFMVYSETGNINCYEVFNDIRGYNSELSADTSQLDSTLTVSVEPFITQGREAYRSILARIAGYGTSSYGAIGYGIRASSQSNDGKPILYCESWPSLTDYEYQCSLADQNLSGGISVVRDIGTVANWIAVQYQDALGVTHTLTPDDDANLKDQTSIDAYGERHALLTLGQIGTTPATQYARSYLSVAKDPQVYINGSLKFAGYLVGKHNTRIPAANVAEGQRLKVVDFVSDVIDTVGAGLTAVITRTEYSDANGGSVSLSFGVPNKLSVMLARIPTVKPSIYKERPSDPRTR